MTTTTPESRGRIAYTAYAVQVGFKGINGDELPMFDDQREDIRNAWIASARAIWELATTGKTIIERPKGEPST